MQNQKLENLLNLSLSATTEEREKSESLNVGYNSELNTWELIVKYSGSLAELTEHGIIVDEMINEYAILTVPEPEIDYVSSLPQIDFIEKPKRLYFAINQAKAASCINLVQRGESDLSGRGVLVAGIDSESIITTMISERRTGIPASSCSGIRHWIRCLPKRRSTRRWPQGAGRGQGRSFPLWIRAATEPQWPQLRQATEERITASTGESRMRAISWW